MRKIILTVILITVIGWTLPAGAVILSDAGLGFVSGQTMHVQVFDDTTGASQQARGFPGRGTNTSGGS